jgi:hypothetical protein
MNRSLYLIFILFFRRKSVWCIVLATGLLALVGCNLTDREYTIDDQYNLARSRIDDMKEQLGFSFMLEKEVVPVGEPIFFTAHFANRIESPLTLRVPQQSGVLDKDHANTTLKYSIIPLDKTISLWTPLLYLGMPYLFTNPVQPSEFVILDSHATKDVRLELPNTVFLKQDETWFEAVLPPGQYWIQITYENLYIGYEIEKADGIYFIDKSAWVGQIDAEPVLLTVVP